MTIKRYLYGERIIKPLQVSSYVRCSPVPPSEQNKFIIKRVRALKKNKQTID